MIIRICAFTDQGRKMADNLIAKWEEPIWQMRTEELALEQWIGESFRKRLPILFIGACGIAVRMIAPFIKDKLTDSPVLVMDEQGCFVIPILSGHVGGANRLARQLSVILGAEPVITTATDVEGSFAVDVFARDNGFRIQNRDGIKKISAKLLRGEQITVAVDREILILDKALPEGLVLVSDEEENVDLRISLKTNDAKGQTLLLVAKEYVLGVGCKRGKDFEELLDFVRRSCPFDPEKETYVISSIDLKKRETGLWNLAQYCHVPLAFYSAEELEKVEGSFTESEFVKKVAGVSNVCERAALLAAGREGVLIREKTAENGMTLAIARRRVVITSWMEQDSAKMPK